MLSLLSDNAMPLAMVPAHYLAISRLFDVFCVLWIFVGFLFLSLNDQQSWKSIALSAESQVVVKKKMKHDWDGSSQQMTTSLIPEIITLISFSVSHFFCYTFCVLYDPEKGRNAEKAGHH